LPGDWAEATGNEGLTTDLIVLIRESKPDESCDLAVRNLMEGKAKAGAVWDAIHLIAGELMLAAGFDRQRTQRSGDALHANTAANALHYAFRASSRADTRLLLTLQGLAWMHLYRRLIREKQLLDETIDITRLPGGKLPDSSQEAIDQVLATRTDEPHHAAGLALSLAERPAGKEQLLRAARALLARKASGDPHDIKFPVAIFEDLDLISPAWQPRLLAASVYSFWGSDRPDNPVMQRVLEAAKAM
jgi:hypothetical protein